MTSHTLHGEKKALFPDTLHKNMGNISNTCTILGISRRTFYDWRNADPEFAAACLEVREAVIDYVESKLFENIAKNDNACMIFWLKCQGKHRGYVERVETTGKDGEAIANEHKIVFPDQNRTVVDIAIENIEQRALSKQKQLEVPDGS